MASFLSQPAGSGRLPRPVSDSTRSPLDTRSEVRRWAEPQTPPLETPPRGLGVPRLPRACPMEGGQGIARLFPTNEKASGEERRGGRHGRGRIKVGLIPKRRSLSGAGSVSLPLALPRYLSLAFSLVVRFSRQKISRGQVQPPEDPSRSGSAELARTTVPGAPKRRGRPAPRSRPGSRLS